MKPLEVKRQGEMNRGLNYLTSDERMRKCLLGRNPPRRVKRKALVQQVNE